MSTAHEIVLLGANQGGVPLVHYLLKHTIPQLNAIDKSHRYHLTIVSPNDHYFWKIAATRAIIDAKQIPQGNIMKPFADIFKQYPADLWQHVLGKATAMDAQSKTISVSLNNGSEKTINYNSLIIATGTHYDSPLWTTQYGTEALKQAHDNLHTRLPLAKTIVVSGGGPVGVESSGELAKNYPKAAITLYSGASRLLETSVKPSVSAEAERQLKALGVNVVHKVRVVDSPRGAGEAATLKLDDGSIVSADVYIQSVGICRTATFVPEAWLEKSRIRADKDTLRVTGPGAENVYVLGDANANSDRQAMWAMDGVRPLASALAIDALKNMKPSEKAEAIKAASPKQSQGLLSWLLGLFGKGEKGSGVGTMQQKFSAMAEGIMAVPIGDSGTGILKGWKLPGWFIHMMKGKTLLVQHMPPQVYGMALDKE